MGSTQASPATRTGRRFPRTRTGTTEMAIGPDDDVGADLFHLFRGRYLDGSDVDQDLAQLRRERIGVAGLAILAAEEPAVVAREGNDGGSEAFRGRNGAAMRH